MLQNFNLNVIHDRFKSIQKQSKMQFNNFNFERGLKSLNNSDLLFTNFAQSEDEKEYNTIIDLYISHLNTEYNILDDFIGYELINDYKVERLLSIINKVQKTKYKEKDVKYILKLNYKYNENIHFFIFMSGNNSSILLIDLYHLGIYGEWYAGGKFKHNSIGKTYKHNKNNMCDLKKIMELAKC